MGAAILDRKSWGPPSWTGNDVKNSIVGPILLLDSAVVEVQEMFRSNGSLLTNAMYHHGETL